MGVEGVRGGSVDARRLTQKSLALWFGSWYNFHMTTTHMNEIERLIAEVLGEEPKAESVVLVHCPAEGSTEDLLLRIDQMVGV